MMESVGAACHHFAQPLTTMLSYLEILARGEGVEESQKSLMLNQCLKAAEIMRVILNKFQEAREYRTRPYLAGMKILDIGLESIYGTPEIPKDKNKP
jgi:signal transduction histidine kinase